jgi:hypothetical protein
MMRESTSRFTFLVEPDDGSVDQEYSKSGSPANSSLPLIYHILYRGAYRASLVDRFRTPLATLNSWDHRSRYRTAIRPDLVLYPLVGHRQTGRQRLGGVPAELLLY